LIVGGGGIDDEVFARSRSIGIENAAADGAKRAIAPVQGIPCHDEAAVGECCHAGAVLVIERSGVDEQLGSEVNYHCNSLYKFPMSHGTHYGALRRAKHHFSRKFALAD